MACSDLISSSRSEAKSLSDLIAAKIFHIPQWKKQKRSWQSNVA